MGVNTAITIFVNKVVEERRIPFTIGKEEDARRMRSWIGLPAPGRRQRNRESRQGIRDADLSATPGTRKTLNMATKYLLDTNVCIDLLRGDAVIQETG